MFRYTNKYKITVSHIVVSALKTLIGTKLRKLALLALMCTFFGQNRLNSTITFSCPEYIVGFHSMYLGYITLHQGLMMMLEWVTWTNLIVPCSLPAWLLHQAHFVLVRSSTRFLKTVKNLYNLLKYDKPWIQIYHCFYGKPDWKKARVWQILKAMIKAEF